MSRSFPAGGTALVNTSARGQGGAPPGYMPYQYTVLRFVPRVAREEFVNVGVVVYSQAAGLLRLAWHLDEPRLRAFAPGADLAALAAQLSALEAICAGEPGSGRPSPGKLIARFGWVSAPRSTVLQPGPVHGGICRDIGAEPARLLDLLVR